MVTCYHTLAFYSYIIEYRKARLGHTERDMTVGPMIVPKCACMVSFLIRGKPVKFYSLFIILGRRPPGNSVTLLNETK